MRNRPGGRWGFKNEAAEQEVGRVYRIGRLLRRAQRHIVVGCPAGVTTITSGSVWSGRDCIGTDLPVNTIFAEGNALK
jgi:hypothetical protein